MLNDVRCFSKVYIAIGYSDFRKGIDGLANVIKFQLELDSFQKDVLFLFCRRRTDCIKVYERLNVERFHWSRNATEALEITSEQYDKSDPISGLWQRDYQISVINERRVTMKIKKVLIICLSAALIMLESPVYADEIYTGMDLDIEYDEGIVSINGQEDDSNNFEKEQFNLEDQVQIIEECDKEASLFSDGADNRQVFKIASDNKAPALESLKLNKNEVTAGEVIIITARITDESGIKGKPQIAFYSEESATHTVYLEDKGNNIYQGFLKITEDFTDGEYSAQWLEAYDVYGNKKLYSLNTDFPEVIFTVKKVQVDNKAPILESLTLDQNKVTVGDIVTITAKITDESGIKGKPQIAFYSEESATHTVYLEDKGNDIYQGFLKITEDFTDGEYPAQWLDVYDVYGNKKLYSLNTNFSEVIISVIDVQKDNKAPVLKSLKLDKNEVIEGNTVTITAQIFDESGVKGRPQIAFYSEESATHTTYLESKGNNIYQGFFKITDDFTSGEYPGQWLDVSDIYGNRKLYSLQNYFPELKIRVLCDVHAWNNGSIIQNVTCIDDGKKLYVCTACGTTKIETIPTLGHKKVTDQTIIPTCETAGKTEGSHCSVCGKIFMQQNIIPAIGHIWDNGIITKIATCKEAGNRTYTCVSCGKTKIEEISTLSHKFGTWRTSSLATVFAPEKQIRICRVCGKEERKSVGSKLKGTMKVSVTSIPLKVQQKTTVLKVTNLAKGDSIVSWRSDHTKIANVSGKTNGTCVIIAGRKVGKTKITITLKSGLHKSVTVFVQKSPIKTRKITGIVKTLKLKIRQKALLNPVVSPITSTEKVTYKSSNSKIVAVNYKGQIIAKKKGTAVITVKSGSKSVKCKVTVK